MADLYNMAQGPDFDPLGAFMAGREAAFQSQVNKNKLAELARMDEARPLFGQAVMGDKNALAGLAQLDPGSALDVQKFNLDQGKSELEQQQKEYERIAGVLTAADTPEKWGQAIQFLEAQGADIAPEERDFNNRAFVIAQGGDEAKKLGLKVRTQITEAGGRRVLVDLNTGKVITDFGPAGAGGGRTQAAPSGYRWTEDQNLEPIPGGPQDPRNKASRGNGGVTTKMLNDAVAVDQAYNNLEGALKDYEGLIKQTGVSALPGQENDAIQQSRTNLQLQLKELYNLGVLNGPDLSLMQNMIFDPQISLASPVDAAGKIYSAIGGKGATSIDDRATASITRVRKMLKEIRDNKTKGILDDNGRPAQPQAQPMPADPAQPEAAQPEATQPEQTGGWNEQDLPQIIQDAQDAIQQGAPIEDVIQEMIDNGVNPEMARTLLNG